MKRIETPTALINATALVACVVAVFSASVTATAEDSLKSSPNSVRLNVDHVGKQQVLLHFGQHGLAYFPDEGISILNKKPLTFLMVAGNVTWLMQGTSWRTSVPVRKVLEPSPGGPDNGYAGVGAVHIDEKNKTVYAFYHAEDQVGYQKLEYNGVTNFMASICLAVGGLDGGQIEKRGQVLTTHKTKNPRSTQPQGVADVTVIPSPDGRYLFAWYTDHSREGDRGVQICMARSPISDCGRPGTWKKWHRGGFSEPGLGGRETPVLSLREAGADAWAPNVVWIPACRRYVMVFNATVYADFKEGAKPTGGIWLTDSLDGIEWSKPTALVTAMAVPIPGKECAIHPSFIVTRASDKFVIGTLLYGYSHKWGHSAHAPPHHLVSRSLRLKAASE